MDIILFILLLIGNKVLNIINNKGPQIVLKVCRHFYLTVIILHEQNIANMQKVTYASAPEEYSVVSILRLVWQSELDLPYHQHDTMAPDPGIVDETISVTKANEKKTWKSF